MAEFSKRSKSAGPAKAKPASTMKSTKASPGLKSIKLKGPTKSAPKSTAPKSSSLQKIKISRPKSK